LWAWFAGVEKAKRCDRVSDFLEAIRKLAPKSGKTLYLVVDEADRLRGRSTGGSSTTREQILPVLARLLELAKINVCTIWISRLDPEQFRGNTIQQMPAPLLFPAYDDAALQKILVKVKLTSILPFHIKPI
jgi:Cdc6-like AAA superfamily ATPase